MNQRIKELAEQAQFSEKDLHIQGDNFQKFAELIIRECGVALSPMLRDMVSRGQAFDLIKEHFGVKV